MSADLALAMVELGSAGATQRQIATTLQSTGLSATIQAAAIHELVDQFTSGGSAGELKVANSLWVQLGLRVEAPYLRQVAEAFGNQTYQVNFASSTATQAINAWVSQETAGHIRQLFGPGDLPLDADLVIANALRFHAAWQRGLLNTAALIPEPFFEATGAKVSVPMLVEPRSVLAYSKTNAYNAVQLPYTNGRFAALLVEPKSGSVGTFLQTLRPGTLSKIADSVRLGHVILTMPSLTLSTRESLNEPLSDMGLAGLFQSADLSPMLGAANGAQQLALVEQAASLRVNDWGTEAAAATGAVFVPFSFGGGASSPSIVFNHPYLFLIRDTTTGAILFSAVVNDPNGA